MTPGPAEHKGTGRHKCPEFKHYADGAENGFAVLTKLVRHFSKWLQSRFMLVTSDGFASAPSRIGRSAQVRFHMLLRRCQRLRCIKRVQVPWPADKPLISVIIPCFNYGTYLKGAIDSVLAQSFKRLEIIVINDGSTDKLTKQILEALDRPKTRVVHQRNQGLAQTRNNGAALGRGKYICYLDPDDFFEPTYLIKTLEVLESDESIGSCYSWVQCFGDSNCLWKTQDLEPFVLVERDTAPAHSVLRKQAWEAVKKHNGMGFLSKYNGYFEDWVFWIDMLQCGYRGVVIEEPLIRYRVHKKSLSAMHRQGFDKMVQVLHEDRKEFFQNRRYLVELERKLNRRIYTENRHINLSCAESQRDCGELDCVAQGLISSTDKGRNA